MLIKKAIFPVAGLGTRFLPATKAQPKEMLPVVDKPLIQYAVEEAYAAGVREMIFVTGRHKRPIEDHFDMTYELEVALQLAHKDELLKVVRSVKPDDMECIYVRQAQALGLGHAVLCGQRLVGNEPFAVVLADDLMVGEPPVLAQMVHQFEEWQASIIAVQTRCAGWPGWRDFRARPLIGVFYGGCFMAMGWLLLAVFQHAPAYVLALSAGFLLMGPFLCLGLYQVQPQDRGRRTPDLGDSLLAWDTTHRHAGHLRLRAAGAGDAVGPRLADRVRGQLRRHARLQGLAAGAARPREPRLHRGLPAVGALFAGLIFAISVVSMPMILDRPVDAITAGLTSLRLVLTQPGVMLCGAR
jgi:CTP:molybdopterin cytidylyltransferase MocA